MSDREEIIKKLATLKTRGLRAGVFGREWCEACGKESSFAGFVSALGTHISFSRFVCGRCSSGELGNESGAAKTEKLDTLILERGFRYCCGCGQRVRLEERTLDEARRTPITCKGCEGIDRGTAARRRYLCHEAEKPGGLERAAARLQWAKRGIEQILDSENEDPTD
jgi:hypothetical protein